jgi:hypothetical protein
VSGDVRSGTALRRRAADAARAPSRPLLVGVWVLAVVLVAWLQVTRYLDPTPPGTDWRDPHNLGDFRDAVWLPGRFLLNGGNPYDAVGYVAEHPWAQEFDLYAPAWLVLAGAMAVLPFRVAAAVYLVLGAGLAALFLRVVLRWAAPQVVALGVPVGLIWFTLWSPSRYALQNGGTFVVFLGCVLVLQGLCRNGSRSGAGPAAIPPPVSVVALGLGAALLKPQFGIPLLVFALAAGRWDAVWRGVLGLAVASAPVAVACVLAAGGPGGFVDSVRANLAYSTSPDSPTGLGSAFNGRIDPIGLAGRFGATDPPSWVGAVVTVACLVWGVWLIRRCRNGVREPDGTGTALVVTAAACAATLLALVHQPYDTVVLVLPAVLGLGATLAGRRPRGLLQATWLAAAVPVLHLHAVTLLVAPWLDRLGADVLDVLALVTVVGLATGVGCRAVQSDGG